MKLNLGCEDQILEGFINIDITPRKGVRVWDLNRFPLPFKDNSVDFILCSHLLEHLDNPIGFMLELHRICKKDAIIDLSVPHFSGFATYSDLDHKRPGMSYFTFGEEWINKILYDKFDIEKKLNFTRINCIWLNKIFNPLINLSPILYERFFCYILPCSEIKFKLKVIKDKIKLNKGSQFCRLNCINNI